MALPVTTPTLGTFCHDSHYPRYWITLLVLVLVGLHAPSLRLIRMQALSVKTNLSCEVDLGAYKSSKVPIVRSNFAFMRRSCSSSFAICAPYRTASIRSSPKHRRVASEPARSKNFAESLFGRHETTNDGCFGPEPWVRAYVERVLVTELAPQPGVALVFHQGPQTPLRLPRMRKMAMVSMAMNCCWRRSRAWRKTPSDGHGSGHGNTEKVFGRERIWPRIRLERCPERPSQTR